MSHIPVSTLLTGWTTIAFDLFDADEFIESLDEAELTGDRILKLSANFVNSASFLFKSNFCFSILKDMDYKLKKTTKLKAITHSFHSSSILLEWKLVSRSNFGAMNSGFLFEVLISEDVAEVK